MTDDDSFAELGVDKRELATELRRRADAEARGGPEEGLGLAIARGRALRRRRRSTIAGLAAAALILTAVAGPRIGEALQSSADETAPAAIPEDELQASAATFALRSVAQAGLMNPLEHFLSYRTAERSGDGWRVAFGSSTCSRTPTEESCEPVSGRDEDGNSNADTYLDVSIDDGEWIVSAAEGPIDDDARAKVLSYREPAEPIDPHPEFAPVVLAEPVNDAEGGGLDVRASGYWAGPFPERRMTFACHLEAYDEDGRLIHEYQAHAYESPATEERRSLGTLGTALPRGVDAARAEMLCERFTGPGWELLEQPAIRPAASGRSVHVRGDVVWRERFVSGVTLACDLRLLDANGAVVGELSLPMGGPWAPTDDPPLTRPLDAIVDISPEGTDVESASFTCEVPAPPNHEPRDDEDDDPDLDDDDEDRSASPMPGPDDRPMPPEGPRYSLASGRFEGSEWGDYEGLEWALEVWANETYTCFGFGVGDQLGDNQGRTCSYLPPDVPEDPVGGHGHIPAAAFDGDVSIAYGEISEEVARVRFELSTGPTTEVEALIPPPELGIDARYFVAFLEPSESRTIVPLDAEGRVIERD